MIRTSASHSASSATMASTGSAAREVFFMGNPSCIEWI